MKTILLSLLIFSQFSLAQNSDEIECTPSKLSPEGIEKLVESLTKTYNSQSVSPLLCQEAKKCYRSEDEEDYFDCKDDMLFKADDEGIFNDDRGACRLTRQEYSALHNYMGSLYSCLNRALYTNKGSSFSSLTSSINAALNRFPSYEGFVFRGSSLPENILADHAVGKTVTYKSFTSTSTSRGTASGFAGGGQLFLIYSYNGKPVMGIPGSEKEVMFKAGTKFKILNVTDKKYVMREVSSKETAAFTKAEDERILALAKAQADKPSPMNIYSGDYWKCPIDSSTMPKKIEQKNIPSTQGFF